MNVHSERKRIGGEEREQRRMPQFVVRPSVRQSAKLIAVVTLMKSSKKHAKQKFYKPISEREKEGAKKVGSSGL